MKIYLYIAVMALTTYLIRMLPLTIFKKEIKSQFVRSFLEYVPCVCLTAMTFPAIMYATNSVFSGIAALAVAIAVAFFGKSLLTVAVCSCVTVFITELIVRMI